VRIFDTATETDIHVPDESWWRAHFMPVCYCCGRHTAAFRTDNHHYKSSCGPCLFFLTVHIHQKDRDWPRVEPAPPLHWRTITRWMKVRYALSMVIEHLHIELHKDDRERYVAWSALWAHRIRGREWSRG